MTQFNQEKRTISYWINKRESILIQHIRYQNLKVCKVIPCLRIVCVNYICLDINLFSDNLTSYDEQDKLNDFGEEFRIFL